MSGSKQTTGSGSSLPSEADDPLKHSLFVSELKTKSRSHPNYPFLCVPSSSLTRLANAHNLTLFQAQHLALENKVIPERYLRNFSSLNIDDQTRLAGSRVLLIGLGGLGGYILEILGRSGAGTFILADGDHFEESNLNRQILGTADNPAESKVWAARTRLEKINPFCRCRIISTFLTRDDLPELMTNSDLVIDALGGIAFRSVLLEEASRAGIPLITGFVAGTTGLASAVYPGGKSPSAFWQGKKDEGAENRLGNMASIVSLIASVQAAEAIKILTSKISGLANRVFLADFESLTFELLEL